VQLILLDCSMFNFDFDELDSQLEALEEPDKASIAAPAFASFDFDSLEALEEESLQTLSTAHPEPQPQPQPQPEVKSADLQTDTKIQQALADAVRRRRKAAGLAEEKVGDSDLTTKIQQAMSEARSRKESNEPKQLTKIEETVQKALASARERQNDPSSFAAFHNSSWEDAGYYSADGQWQNQSKEWKTGSTYGSWWPTALPTTRSNWNTEDDGWDLPIQVTQQMNMTKQARVQLGKACMDAKVLDDELNQVLSDAKARQSQQKVSAPSEPSVPDRTAVQIQQAQMVAESRSYLANDLLQARRMAPYRPNPAIEVEQSKDKGCQDDRCVICSPRGQDTKKEDFTVPETSHQAATAPRRLRQKTATPARVWRPVQQAPAQAKHARWSDECDSSEGEGEGCSPRQRGGG